jgi:hypothetical protein
MSSGNNLKQLALAAQNHASAHDDTLPPGGTFDARGNGLHGWQTLLLPYVEEEALYKRIDQTVPWSDPSNAGPMCTVVKPYLHLLGKETVSDAGFGLSHYAANVRLLGAGKPRTFASIADGASNTILAGEAWTAFKPWGHPANWRDPAIGLHTAPNSFGSPMGSNFVLFAMADGSVRGVKKDIDPQVLRAFSTPDGGEDHNALDW